MLYHLPENFIGGAVFLAPRDEAITDADGYAGYFVIMNFLRPLLARDDFTGATPGFYINLIDREGVITLRLNYFSVDASKTLGAIDGFVQGSGNMNIHAIEPENNLSKSQAEYNDGKFELDFKNFLNANTRICLEMLQNFGGSEFRNLVATYRHAYFPQGVRPEEIFEASSIQHSLSFAVLYDGSPSRTRDCFFRFLVAIVSPLYHAA